MDSAEVQRIRSQFEAMLLRPVLQPLTQALGEYGDMFVDEFAQLLARSLRG
jgi:hypothetical protein